MNSNSGALNFDAYISDSDFNKTIQSMNRNIMSLSTTAKKETNETANSFKNLASIAAGSLAGLGLAQLPGQLIRVRGEFQQLETSFRVMLGSKVQADKLMADVVKFAATTPFDLAGVAGATKQLLAYGFASEDVINTLRRLGDISSGLNIPLNEMTEIYGKAKVGGRLYAEDFNKFVDRGIPVIGLLAKQFKLVADEAGTADSKVKKLVEDGKVGFEDIKKAVETLTNSGGMFAGLTAENAKSLTGLYSNFEDTISQMFNKIGKEQEGLLAGSIQFATTVVENYEPILDVLTVIVAAYGTYKAAVIATAAVQSLAAGGGAVLAWLELAAGIRSAKDAQIAFNLATSANPWVLAATALVTLVTAVALFSDEVTEASKAQERNLAITEKLNNTHAEEVSKLQLLQKQITDETLSRDQRNAKLKELIAISPAHFNALKLDTFATGEGAKAIEEYTKALEKKLSLQAKEEQIVANNKRQRDIETGVLDDEFKPNLGERALFFLQDSGFDEKKFKGETDKRKKAAIKALQDENKALLDEAAKDANRKKEAPIAVSPPKVKEKAKKAEKEIADVRGETFAEELERKKKLYELYERWTLNYGKKAADEQFKTLLDAGKSYLDYVNYKIYALENIKNYQGNPTDTDLIDLDKLIGERATLTGGKSPMDAFRDQLDNARESASSLTEELQNLTKIREGLGPTTGNGMQADQIALVVQRQQEVQKAQKKLLQDFLLDVAGSEQRRLEITTHYGELRQAAEVRFGKEKGDEYKKVIGRINKAEEKELKDDKEQALKAREEYKALLKIAAKNGEELTQIDVDNARKRFEELTAGLDKTSDAYKEHYDTLTKIENEYAQKRGARIAALSSIASSIFDSIGGGVGEIGRDLVNVTSKVLNLANALSTVKKNADGSFNFAAAANWVTLIIEVINFGIKTNKKLNALADDRLKNYQDFIREVDIARNNKIGEPGKKTPFYTDYNSAIEAGVNQYADAQKKYDAAVAEINKGRVIVGFNGGFFKKDKNIYADLLKVYPELVDAAGNLNVEMAKTLLSTGQLDANTKNLVQNAVDWADQLEKAQAQIWDNIVTLTGQIGESLTDAMYSGFQNGIDAAQSWGDAVGDIIGKVVKQTTLIKFLQPALDQLTAEINKSYNKDTGDFNIIDDLNRFKDYGFAGFEAGAKFMEQFDAWAKANGYTDVFGKGSGASSSGSQGALEGRVSGASEETISVLVGQFNAVRIYQAQLVNLTQVSNGHLSVIATNTSYNKQLLFLPDVVDRLDKINATNTRGFGL